MVGACNDETYFQHKLLLTNTFIYTKYYENIIMFYAKYYTLLYKMLLTNNIKLSKTQLS